MTTMTLALDIIKPREAVDLAKLNRKSIKYINGLKLGHDFASWQKPTTKRPLRYELF
jgi:hypothetical protein